MRASARRVFIAGWAVLTGASGLAGLGGPAELESAGRALLGDPLADVRLAQRGDLVDPAMQHGVRSFAQGIAPRSEVNRLRQHRRPQQFAQGVAARIEPAISYANSTPPALSARICSCASAWPASSNTPHG